MGASRASIVVMSPESETASVNGSVNGSGTGSVNGSGTASVNGSVNGSVTASATATGSVSGSGIGAIITDMSVRVTRTTIDRNMTGSNVIEAEKKSHLTRKRLQRIQVMSGKQYLVSTVDVNTIKAISLNFLHLMSAGLLRPRDGILSLPNWLC